MGLKPRVGRPPKEVTRDRRFQMRLTEEEWQVLERAAAKAGASVAAWLRRLARVAVRKDERKR